MPDETTLCRFRGELVRRGLTERLLAAVDAQLAGRGLVLKRGTLIDASLVEADADVRKGPDGGPVTVEREAGSPGCAYRVFRHSIAAVRSVSDSMSTNWWPPLS